MDSKGKVFDIWGNSVIDGSLSYAVASPVVAVPFSDIWLAAKSRPKNPDPAPEEVPKGESAPENPPPTQPDEELSPTPASPKPAPDEPPPLDNKTASKAQKPPAPAFWQNKKFQAAAGGMSLVIFGLAVFLFIARGSLAPIYLADMRIEPNQNDTQLQKQISARTAKYSLAFQDINGKTSHYPLASVGVHVDAKATASQTTQQITDGYFKRLIWWKPIKLSLVTETDKDLFQKFLGESIIKPTVPYQNASFVIKGNQVDISTEKRGHGQTLANPYIDVPEAVAAMSTKPIKMRQSTIPAPISRGNLITQKPKLEKMLSQKITLHLDNTVVTVKPNDIAGWLDLNPVEHDKTIDINVNSGKVLAYLNKIAAPYIQPPRSRLVTTEPDGSQTVLDPGADGIDILNKDQTASAITQAAMGSKGLDQKLDINHANAKTIEVKPADKWIVVDVTAKRMYAYEQTNLVRTFLVSAGAPKTPTVLGQYTIYSKFAVQDMRGSNADGSRYFQPNVRWINYFYKDYAVHGNYWRPTSWFGNINSSHGCVGVVEDDGKWIYDWAPIGTPVIVHP